VSDQIKVELQSFWGSDRVIAETAWVSSKLNEARLSMPDDDVERLVKQLAEQKHGSPFEQVYFRFWIKLPIVADRHIMTHRMKSSNSLSGRYRTMPTEFLTIDSEVTDIIKKFNGVYRGPNDLDLIFEYNNICKEANYVYYKGIDAAKEGLKNGSITKEEYKRFREFYRGILPQHNITERIVTMNLRSLANFFKQRLTKDAQKEIRQIAELMLEEVKTANICPVALSTLEKTGWDI
jgi:thymidylate synthase (FAD)